MDYALPDLPETFWVDTHCHLYMEPFRDDLPEVLSRAQHQGVMGYVVPGIDLETSRAAIELSEHYPSVFAAVGIHPNYATRWENTSLQELRALSSHPKVVAIGEIGLDYYRDYAPPELQKAALIAQLELAAERNLPVILHQRNSFHDLQIILKAWLQGTESPNTPTQGARGVFHAFEGGAEELTWITQHGFYIGLAGAITYRSLERTQSLVQLLPWDHVVLETDSPYLTPVPHRGKRNEPTYIPLIAEKISSLSNIPLPTLANTTSTNAIRLFNLPSSWSSH